ncbi:MAG: stage II sporulation protein D [Bacteroidota bacterium]
MRPNMGLTLVLLMLLLSLLPLLIIKKITDLPKWGGIPVTLVSRAEGRVYRFDLEQYLVGVVAAEMPARFELEALKAQAVAARTLAVRRMKRFGGKGCQHYANADLCDDPTEHQAWLSEASLRKRWSGWSFYSYNNKIKRAVKETSGIIMTYQNRPIDAVFHSTCGGWTASAKDIWNNEIPYLIRVKCDFDRHAPRYKNTFFYTWAELERRFRIPGKLFINLRAVSLTDQRRIATLKVGKELIRGGDFRSKLGLTSTCFSWNITDLGLTFVVTGYGHGVGLCQYGADGLAKKGWKFNRILSYYYQGIGFHKLQIPGNGKF